MSQYAVFIQEGFGLDGQSVYFTNEAPRYEAESFPVYARTAEGATHVGEREETFIVFTPLNGPYRMKNRENRVPLQRLLSVIEQTNGNSETEGDSNV